MDFPIVAEVIRSGVVESFHTGSWALADPNGRIIWEGGDLDRPVYIRSCSKLFQTLPIIETGAATRFGLTDAELAVISSSHNAEPVHIKTVRSILAKGGIDESWLQCGPDAPEHKPSLNEVMRTEGKFSPIHNNCSGKHSGMLLLALHIGADPRTYKDISNPVQILSMQAYARVAGIDVSKIGVGHDGCDVPAFVTTLRDSAIAMARYASPSCLGDEALKNAILRLTGAIIAEPYMLAGEGRFCTALAMAGKGAIIGKTGAEAGYLAALPRHGLGFASKVNDGTYRASYAFLARIFDEMGLFAKPLVEEMKKFRHSVERNTCGRAIGEIIVPPSVIAEAPKL